MGYIYGIMLRTANPTEELNTKRLLHIRVFGFKDLAREPSHVSADTTETNMGPLQLVLSGRRGIDDQSCQSSAVIPGGSQQGSSSITSVHVYELLPLNPEP